MKALGMNCGVVLAASLMSPAAARARSATADVLDSARSTMGRLERTGALVASGVLKSSSDAGRWTQAVDMRNGRFIARSSFRLFSVSSGYDGRTLWKQDRSGTSHRLDAPFSRAEALTQSWLLRRGYLEPKGARYGYIGQGQIGTHSVVTLLAVPNGGNPVQLAFDRASHLLVQLTRELPNHISVERYADYRRVGRVLMPFRIESGEGADTAISVTRYDLRAASTARFAVPPRPRDTRISAVRPVALDGRSYPSITARVNGKDYDFIVDTGGHNILTPAVAEKLGLMVDGQGSSAGGGTGTVTQRDTRVRELQVGGATMSDQHFYVIDLGPAVVRQDKPPLGGVLGLEVFERVAVTFDVPRGTLTAMPFALARCDGHSVPIRFDDDMPLVMGSVDGMPGLIAIDTGNGGLPIILWRWATANGVAGTFLKGQTIEGSGLGGKSPLVRSPHHRLLIGEVELADQEVAYSRDRAGTFSSRTEAANIGHPLLAHGPVTFDYSRGVMCIGPDRKSSPGRAAP